MTAPDPSQRQPDSGTAAVVAADWDPRAKPLRSPAHDASSLLPRQRLQQLYAISRVLIRADDAEAGIREVLALLDQTLPIRSAVFILGDRVPLWIVWSSASVSADQLQAAKDFAQSGYDYLLGTEFLPYGQLAARPPSAPPSTPAEALDRRKLIRLPLVVEQRGSFGVLQLEGVERFNELDLVFVSAIALDLGSALARQSVIEQRDATTERRRAEAEARQLLAEARQVHAESVAQQARVERARADFGRAAAEAALAQSQRSTLASEALSERYRALLDHIQGGFVWESDSSTQLLSYASAAVEGLLGFPRQRWLERPGFLLERLYPDDRTAVEQMLRGVTVAGGGRCEHRFVSAQGQVVWFQTGVCCSPGIKDKLQGISLRIAPPAQPWAAPRSENLQRSAERLDPLIRGLLDSAGLATGALELESVSAARLVGEAFESLLPLAQGKGVQLKSTVIGEMPDVRADASRVQQVFSKLIGNAIEFTPAGGAVVLRAERSVRHVRFSVRDAGPGIAQSDLVHLFDRFWQARRKARLGTGLGLSIARGIVSAHGGRLWVESRVEVGSTFYFTLPIG